MGATTKRQQTHPKVMRKMVKELSTDQRFIRKRNTTIKKPMKAHHVTVPSPDPKSSKVFG